VLSPTVEEIFWQTVDGWKTRQARIRILCRQQPREFCFTAKVKTIAGTSVTFYDAETEQEQRIDFHDAEFRQLDPELEVKIAFGAVWDSEDLLEHHVGCVFKELREAN
jgi:hypothetical protein